MRTHIYVDGFNLYYGSLKGTPYKWLDLSCLFREILHPRHLIQKIKFFTAPLSSSRSNNRRVSEEQNAYLRALRSHCKEVEVIMGSFVTHSIKMPLVNPSDSQEFAEVLKTEEKGSDVNVAVHLLNDAWLNSYDCAVVVTNDSDISESMRLVKKQHSKKLGLVTPGNRYPSQHLVRYADFQRHIRKGALKRCQFPILIPETNITKPKRW
ncbi:MAG: NYN domain-containing protein [Gammaproteobacteria bacterium]|nr:NYN domain-containing protein [Gammaproteobacteria bacterium]